MSRVEDGFVRLVLCAAFVLAASAALGGNLVDRYNVVWTTPSKDSSGSMPLGNGDIGLNLWVEDGGDLVFYISKTDAWDENCRLLKLGRVRVRLSPNPFEAGAPFRQELKLRQGEIDISGGKSGQETHMRVWVDANQPVVRVEVESPQELDVRAQLEVWRTEKTPDTILPPSGDRIAWYHRNQSSIWATTLKHQGLNAWLKRGSDPLMNLTFGGVIRGTGLVSDGPTALRSPRPTRKCTISAYIHTSQAETPDGWLSKIEEVSEAIDALGVGEARAAHLKWWEQFWNRSWIAVRQEPNVSQCYALQRFVSACAGRGAYPIKFNGSLFTVDSREPEEQHDADYRRWGGCYWFQNTRLAYWPMLASGDCEMMRPLFRMYTANLPFLKYRTRAYYAHDGAYFPETMYFWGAYADHDYGRPASQKPSGEVDNHYIARHFNGSLELLALMLDYYNYTGDEEFLRGEMLPFADEILAWWSEHYKRDQKGLIRMEPAQALETWQKCINPSCDIAGLKWVLGGLLKLPGADLGAQRRARWQKLLAEVPPLPTSSENGKTWLLGAEKILEPTGNSENPELYAVFPFRLYGVGKPDIEIGRETWARRIHRAGFGWQQNDTQAAFLGLANEARDYVVSRFANKHPGSRFPAFWGPNYDWIPDQDHGSNGVMALQTMLLQADGDRIILFPAWPKEWDVEFKLRAPRNTTVEGVYRAGKLERLVVTPSRRAKDVETRE